MNDTQRKIQPNIQPIQTNFILQAENFRLNNHIPVYAIHSGTEEIVKIDLLFRAGNWYQPKPLVATASNEMLQEGSKKYSSEEIAKHMDYYGALLSMNTNKDVGFITLLTLKKYLKETLAMLMDIITQPDYPPDELETYINQKKQDFLLEQAKVKNLSRRKFNEALFGTHHPYGKMLQLEDHNNLIRDDLVQFHQNHYHPSNCEILLTGKIDHTVYQVIKEIMGKSQWAGKQPTHAPDFAPFTTQETEIFTPVDHAVQSAIRIGKIMFGKHHPDYPGLQVVNTLLGGYFGSRLMKKIREEKGYTYGIQSMLVPLVNEGYFVIGSEVGSGVCRKAISAIYEEIKKLRTDKVKAEELTMVKNYMMGQLMRAFDGPISLSGTYLALMELRLKEDYYQQVIHTIKNISAEDILELANKYLNEEDMIRSVAGKCE